MKRIISLLIILTFIAFYPAQGVATYVQDSTATVLHIDQDYLNERAADEAFDYSISHARNASLFDRIVAFLLGLLAMIFQWGNDSLLGRVILYGLILGAIVYTILKLMEKNPLSMLRKKEEKIGYDVQTENIHDISFSEQLAVALDDHNFKLAVRLQYLWTLKDLTDKGRIDWKPGKSNTEYMYELSSSGLARPFTTLSRYFDLHWYGGHPVNKNDFDETRQLSQKILDA